MTTHVSYSACEEDQLRVEVEVLRIEIEELEKKLSDRDRNIAALVRALRNDNKPWGLARTLAERPPWEDDPWSCEAREDEPYDPYPHAHALMISLASRWRRG